MSSKRKRVIRSINWLNSNRSNNGSRKNLLNNIISSFSRRSNDSSLGRRRLLQVGLRMKIKLILPPRGPSCQNLWLPRKIQCPSKMSDMYYQSKVKTLEFIRQKTLKLQICHYQATIRGQPWTSCLKNGIKLLKERRKFLLLLFTSTLWTKYPQ